MSKITRAEPSSIQDLTLDQSKRLLMGVLSDYGWDGVILYKYLQSWKNQVEKKIC